MMGYKLKDLIDIDHFQKLQDRLNKIYSFPSSILDNDGNILTATAWQEICMQFHRKNKEAERICIKSDQYIKDHIHEANPALSYRCPHGLVDNAIPIIIDGVHYGNFFTGQFFLEEPDLAFFSSQAKKYGFDENAYLAAVKKVPIWSQKQLDNYLFFIKGLIEIIAESGLKNLREIENQKQLQKKEQRNRTILKTAMDGFWVTDTDGRLLEVNDTYCRISGYSESELLAMHIWDLEVFETRDIVTGHIRKVISAGSDRFQSRHRKKDGSVFDVEISVQFRHEQGGRCVCFLRDISDRKQIEAERENMIQVLEILNAKTDIRELMRSLIDFIQEISGCESVGIRLREGNDFPYYETRGFSDDFIKTETHLCVQDIHGQLERDDIGNPLLECMCGNIIRGRTDSSKPFFTPFGSFVTNSTTRLLADTSEADRQARTRNRCNGEGYESVLLIPLRAGGETFGLLQFNDRQENRFSSQVIAHLERIAGNVALGLAKHESEEALRRHRDLLNTTQQIAHIGGWEWDIKRQTMAWTDETYRIHGMKPGEPSPGCSELIDRSLACYDPDDRPVIRAAFRRCIAEGLTYDLDFILTRVDGQRIWVRTMAHAVKEDGRIAKVVGNIIDITERKQAEAKLNTAHEKMLTILDSIDSTVYVADMDTHEILFMNKKMITDFGGDKTGEKCFKAFRNKSEPCGFCNNDRLLDADGKPAGVLIWNDQNNITGKYYINHDRAIEWTDGSLVRMQIATDITDLKNMEAQLHQAQKMESVGRLAGGVAHDFNNMLGVILGHVGFALEKAEQGHELHADLKEIQTAAKRSANLTKQLLTFARKDIISPKKLDLNDTVESMLNMLRRLIGEDIDLVWKPSVHLWSVKMDPSQINQILANLCVNARDAIAGVGKLTIETGRKSFDEQYCSEHPGFIPGDFVLLTVSDNGSGMDKETLDNLFEPFFTTKDVGKGTGLGLATIYGIVKQNNGFINVYSEPGQGSTFNIYLPRLVAGEDIDKTAPEKKAIAGGTETILLVEDEPTILRMTRMMLERKGYSVLSAATPTEAVEKATHHSGPIDMLMTDVVMPEMNGRDLAGKITPLYPDIRLLFMSGYTANVIAHQGVLDDGVAFIQKPFSMADMTEKVREVLDMSIDKNQG
jgi:PAS domain S-box-containing protein